MSNTNKYYNILRLAFAFKRMAEDPASVSETGGILDSAFNKAEAIAKAIKLGLLEEFRIFLSKIEERIEDGAKLSKAVYFFFEIAKILGRKIIGSTTKVADICFHIFEGKYEAAAWEFLILVVPGLNTLVTIDNGRLILLKELKEIERWFLERREEVIFQINQLLSTILGGEINVGAEYMFEDLLKIIRSAASNGEITL